MSHIPHFSFPPFGRVRVGVRVVFYSVGLIYFPYTYPHIPESRIINIGEIPIIYMASAQPIGIQQFENVMQASLASLNVGTAISATTAGRMPRNIAATTVLSLN